VAFAALVMSCRAAESMNEAEHGFSDGQKSPMTAKMSFVHLRTSNPALACPKLFGDRDELVAITLQFRRADPADHEQACLAGRQHGGD